MAGERSSREVRWEGEEAGARLRALVRQRPRREGLVRVGIELPCGRGRLAIGHQRDLDGGGARGWSTALGIRRRPRGPVLSLGRASSGISWRGPVGDAAVTLAAGRRTSGAAVGGAHVAWRGVETYAHADGGARKWGIAGSGRWGGLPWRVELGRAAKGWAGRAALGGGASPLGMTAGAGSGAGGRTVAGGIRAGRGPARGTRMEVGIREAETAVTIRLVSRAGSWRFESELRARAAPRVRVSAECRRPVATVSVVLSGPAPGAVFRLESGPPRARVGLRADLPAGRPRRVALWLGRDSRWGRFRVRVRRDRDEPPSVEVEWERRRRRARD